MLVRIEVLDANDNSPEFINLPSRLSVEENRVESGLYQLLAIDRDFGNFGMVEFSIEGADGAMIVDSKVGMTSSVRRIFERGGARKFENNEDQNENIPAQKQVRFPAQN